MEITSPKNKHIKEALLLYKASARRKRNEIIIEGLNECKRALYNGIKPKTVFVYDGCSNDILSDIDALHIEPIKCSKSVFEKLCIREELAKICMICEKPNSDITLFAPPNQGLYLVMEKVEKPGNLGALVRTAIATDVNAIILTDSQTDAYNPNVIRASQGAIFELPIFNLSNTETLDFFTSNNITTMATLPLATESIYSISFVNSTAILLGTESTGLSSFWIENCDKKVIIPMRGSIDSLNVSVSGAVCLYEALRQRLN